MGRGWVGDSSCAEGKGQAPRIGPAQAHMSRLAYLREVPLAAVGNRENGKMHLWLGRPCSYEQSFPDTGW